jgi:hypothetical protein
MSLGIVIFLIALTAILFGSRLASIKPSAWFFLSMGISLLCAGFMTDHLGTQAPVTSNPWPLWVGGVFITFFGVVLIKPKAKTHR